MGNLYFPHRKGDLKLVISKSNHVIHFECYMINKYLNIHISFCIRN